MTARKIGTQRAWVAQDETSKPDYDLSWIVTPPNVSVGDLPVLVVPEAAVSGCKHDGHRPLGGSCGFVRWCPNCGACMHTDTGRWRKPRILRVTKEGKR